MSFFGGFVGRTDPYASRRQQAFEALESRQLLDGLPFAAGHTIVDLKTTYGDIWIELFDQEAPLTVANFLNYVNNNKFDNTFIHRSIENFVVQMGGYTFDTVQGAPEHIQTFAPVHNEFSSSRLNLLRTVAMAKLPATAPGGGPDSATSEFFFNLKNNTDLDTQNGGFTVFGQVVNGWDVVLKITSLQTVNAAQGFENLPVRENWSGGLVTEQNLVFITDVVTITNVGWDQHGNAGKNVVGAANAAGASIFVTVNSLARPVAFYQPSPTGDWQVSDLSIQSGSSSVAGQVVTWADPKDGRFYVAAPTVSGLLLYTRNSNGIWSVRNLNDEIPGSSILPVSASLTVLTSTDQFITVAGLNAQGQIVLFTQSSKTSTGGNYPWTFVNVHLADLVSRGMTTPGFAGQLTSYVTSWNGQNIVGLDGSGNVQAVWRTPGFDDFRWRVDNLSALTGAPPLTGNLSPYLNSWGGVNLAGTDASGKILVTWWNGDPNSGWSTLKMTEAYGGASPLPLVVGSLSSYVYPWDGANIAGLTADGKIVVYWWGGPGDLADPIWKVTVLTDFIAGASPVAGKISTTVSPAAGQISLTGLDASGNVLRYNWKPGDAWNMQNLTSMAKFW